MENDANIMTPGYTYTASYNTQQAVVNAALRPALSLSGADPRPDSDYDAEQLKKGMAIEAEHCKDPEVQKFITKDHLDENKDYYVLLEKLGL